MYRFLLTPRWLGAAVLSVVAAVIMVMLGNWQLHRYQERSAINHRIDAAAGNQRMNIAELRCRGHGRERRVLDVAAVMFDQDKNCHNSYQ